MHVPFYFGFTAVSLYLFCSDFSNKQAKVVFIFDRYSFSFVFKKKKKILLLSLKNIFSGAKHSQEIATLPSCSVLHHGQHIEQRPILGFLTEPAAHSNMPAFSLPHWAEDRHPLSKLSTSCCGYSVPFYGGKLSVSSCVTPSPGYMVNKQLPGLMK